MQKKWQDYNFWMHNIIEQLDKLNHSKPVILWDRFLSDCVHSEDKLYASEILRVMKSHSKKIVIFIDVPDACLKQRGTKEGDQLEAHKRNYLKTLASFNVLTIKPDKESNYFITDAHLEQAYKFIKDNM